MINKFQAALITVVIVIGIIVSILLVILPDTVQKTPIPDEDKQFETTPDEAAFQDEVLKEVESSFKPVNGSREVVSPKGFFIKGCVRGKDTNENIQVFDLQIHRKLKKGKSYNQKTAKGGSNNWKEKKGISNNLDGKKGTNDKWKTIIHETVNTDAGSFNYPVNDAGVYRVAVRSSRHKKHITDEFTLSEKNRTIELVISLESGYSIRGVVVDDDTDNPIEDARVFVLNKREQDSLFWFLRGFEERRINTTTNARGEFLLRGLEKEYTLIAALHHHYAATYVEAESGTNAKVEIRLMKGPVIYGKAFDDNGNPVSKLLITVTGSPLPIPRYVLTDEAGGFRTAPMRPGRIFVHASPIPERETKKKSPLFTPETQVVTMQDSDEEVIFGPSPDKVIWRGHLLKGSKEPVSHGIVEVSPTSIHGKEAYYFNAASTASCNKEGLFEFKKLVPGTYRVRIYFPKRSLHFVWGNIELEMPGLTEMDIHLSGGEIHGMVVDQITENSVTGVKGEVYARIKKQNNKSKNYTAVLDEEGCFHFYGVDPGEYQLISVIEESTTRGYKTCIVGENEVVKNIKLPIIHGGRFLLKLCEFNINEGNEFNLSVRRLDDAHDDKGKSGGKGKNIEKGWKESPVGKVDWQTEFTLDPGEYEVLLEFLRFGTVKRAFEIFPGETTFVEIFRYELGSAATDVFDITGTVEYQDGIPLSGAYVRAIANEGPWEDMRKTDREGRFTLKGIRSGTWKMDVWVPGSASKTGINCQDLVIPEGDTSPAPLVIVISIGIIRGELYDASTGRTLGERSKSWRVVIRDVKTEKVITQSYGGYSGNGISEFSISGIDEGEYKLIITADGYKAYRSDPITLLKYQIQDLGRIELKPEDGGE